MKILMTLMRLDIGGAETHVVELSKELKARGHDITVASNGGVYVSELESAGVRHVKLPLHTKSPFAMIKSYRGLKKLIKRENFDIVHAHARIPGFICGKLAKKLGFKFITSTHGVFKVNPLLRRLSDWGEHSIAVSYDIKQYLIDNYHIPSDNITLTINGIDTAKFSQDTPSDAVKREFGLSDLAFRVVYVSRIDTEAALPGFLLCDAAERLANELPLLEILIVGAGTAFENLKERAAEVNKKVGRQIIKLTGARTDVANLIASGDVFVGVSRAALEAMSEEKPVILAGAQGYIGIYSEKVRTLAESTNFCCRGQILPTAEHLASDIRTLYHMNPADRERLGRFGRSVILWGYSVSRMADDCLGAYEKLVPCKKYKHGDIIISGYYGFENMGDDSLLLSMITGIREIDPTVKITVLTNSPKKTADACGVRTIYRYNIFSIKSEMKKAKLLISGGGSLLQDGTSKKSLCYYVYIMKMAKRYGLKLMLYANGLGPLVSEESRKLAAGIIRDADYVSLRESKSVELAAELGIHPQNLVLSADPAFLLKPAEPEWVNYIIRREEIKKRFFIVSVKEGNNFELGNSSKKSPHLIESLAADIASIADKYELTPIFVPMHSGKDTDVTEALLNAAGRGKIIDNLSASELCGLMSRSEFVIGTRLHMLIFAASMGIPMVGIAYDPKISAFLEYIGHSASCLDIRTIAPKQVEEVVNRIWLGSRSMRNHLALTAEMLRHNAKTDCDAAIRLLKEQNSLLLAKKSIKSKKLKKMKR
jgi:polysaccharide pyruvyl transferase CsaB